MKNSDALCVQSARYHFVYQHEVISHHYVEQVACFHEVVDVLHRPWWNVVATGRLLLKRIEHGL